MLVSIVRKIPQGELSKGSHGGKALHIVIVTQTLWRDYSSAITGLDFLHITASDLQLKVDDIQRYYSLAGIDISNAEVKKVFDFTDGWIIAVYLLLCVSVREK